MESLVEGAREPSSFLQWQKEMRERDLQEKLAKIEHRRLEGRISYEEAAMARTRLMERNQKTAKLKKEEVFEEEYFKEDQNISVLCNRFCSVVRIPFKAIDYYV